MTEMNEGFVPEQQNNSGAEAGTGTYGLEALFGGAIGGVAGFFSGRKSGYDKAIDDIAKATNKHPDTLRKELEAAKGKKKQKPKKGKLHLFYREPTAEEVKSEPAKAETEVKEERDETPKSEKKEEAKEAKTE